MKSESISSSGEERVKAPYSRENILNKLSEVVSFNELVDALFTGPKHLSFEEIVSLVETAAESNPNLNRFLDLLRDQDLMAQKMAGMHGFMEHNLNHLPEGMSPEDYQQLDLKLKDAFFGFKFLLKMQILNLQKEAFLPENEPQNFTELNKFCFSVAQDFSKFKREAIEEFVDLLEIKLGEEGADTVLVNFYQHLIDFFKEKGLVVDEDPARFDDIREKLEYFGVIQSLLYLKNVLMTLFSRIPIKQALEMPEVLQTKDFDGFRPVISGENLFEGVVEQLNTNKDVRKAVLSFMNLLEE